MTCKQEKYQSIETDTRLRKRIKSEGNILSFPVKNEVKVGHNEERNRVYIKDLMEMLEVKNTT